MPIINPPPFIAKRVKTFDQSVDQHLSSLLRNSKTADWVFYGASAVGDHGLLWMGLAGLQALRQPRPDWKRRMVRTVGGLGVESILINGPVKYLFRRERPVYEGDRPMHLRQPRTSSFPSGHSSAAFFGAAVLRDDDDWWPLYYAVALIVATSRLHVRIHHASDVIGGAVAGVVLGEMARKMVPLEPRPGA